MNYLSVERLTKSFDEKQLFEEITFGLEQGQKAALVGVNGCGKSTLLKVIAGLLYPNSGEVTFRKGISLSILTQNPEFADERYGDASRFFQRPRRAQSHSKL